MSLTISVCRYLSIEIHAIKQVIVTNKDFICFQGGQVTTGSSNLEQLVHKTLSLSVLTCKCTYLDFFLSKICTDRSGNCHRYFCCALDFLIQYGEIHEF